jgi:SAM-dependent methyltransferase
MGVSPELRNQIMAQAQGAMALYAAFVGLANPLFSTLAKSGKSTPGELAKQTGLDPGYVSRWCDAAFAFGYLEETDSQLQITDLGRAFLPETAGTVMPFAVFPMLAAHMSERAATFMKTGERPGEKVLAERESILPLFGLMLETTFSSMFEQQILPNVPVYQDTDEKGGVAVDLGCGNGWYLRKMAHRFPQLRGVGLDGFAENITHATQLAQQEGLGDRLTFTAGDIHQFTIDEPVDLIAMNRALHHVWSEKENVFRILKEHLKPGGAAVIWEPNWPQTRAALREPGKSGMALSNLFEYVQGNHFLRPEEIQAAFHQVGMETSVQLFANGNEAVIVGTKS